MRKYLLIVALILINSLRAFPQANLLLVDSLRIESLKKILPTLIGNRRIDCLNDLAKEYYFQIRNESLLYIDSISIYAGKAREESLKSSYDYGLAFSLIFLSYYEGFKKDTSKSAEYKKQALSIGNKLDNGSILGWVYYARWELKKALDYFRSVGDEESEAEVCTWLCYQYTLENRFYEDNKYQLEGFDFCQRAIELSKKRWNRTIGWGLYISQFASEIMASLCNEIGDYESALDYIQSARQYSGESGYDMYNSLGDVYYFKGQYDSAAYYQQLFLQHKPDNPFAMKALGETYLKMKEYDKALPLFQQSLNKIDRRSMAFPSVYYLNIGKAYAGKKDFKLALKYANEGYALSQKQKNKKTSKKNEMNACELLSTIYNQTGKNDLAFKYLKKHMYIKDSLQHQKFLWRLSMQLYKFRKVTEENKKTSQINLLNKDNQLKEQKLKQQAIAKNGLIAGILLLLLLGIFVTRTLFLKRRNEKLRSLQLENDLKVQQLENEKKHTDFQKKTADLEMQALRAQMNPHFIFNCLSSINRFILKNEPDTASDYLTRFSRLIRMVLLNSQKQLITLEDELEMLTIYLDMERLRFKNNFDYHIVFTNRVDAGAIFIPSLLLQPFCENAIWHGLKHLSDPQSGRQEQGQLDIELSMDDKILNCIITDNGIGREKASEIRSKSAEEKKSMGLKITTDRLALLNGEKGLATFYEIEDLKDEKGNATGTKVILKISYKESVEESV